MTSKGFQCSTLRCSWWFQAYMQRHQLSLVGSQTIVCLPFWDIRNLWSSWLWANLWYIVGGHHRRSIGSAFQIGLGNGKIASGLCNKPVSVHRTWQFPWHAQLRESLHHLPLLLRTNHATFADTACCLASCFIPSWWLLRIGWYWLGTIEGRIRG